MHLYARQLREKAAKSFRGSLSTLGLSHLFQILELSRKTGRLRIMPPLDREAVLEFAEGQPVWAAFGVLEGEPAICRLLQLDGGQFEFREGELSGRRNIFRPTAAVLLDAMRVLDEGESGR